MAEHNQRERLEADIRGMDDQIKEFNAHWLNHRHIMSAFAAIILALILTGMFLKTVELYLWGFGGILMICFVGVMIWRTKEAERLNIEMEAAQKAFKDYERGRRK